MKRILVVALLSGAVAFVPAGARAALQSTVGPPPAPSDKVRASALVSVYNRPIIRFRAPMLGMSVGERAEAATERVRTLLAAPGEHKVTSEQTPKGVLVKIDNNIALAVTHDDAEGLGEEAEAAKAADAVRALERVIAEMNEARDPRALLASAGWALGATCLFIMGLWFIRVVVRRGGRRLLRYADARGAALRAAGAEIVLPDRVVAAIRVVIRAFYWTLALLLTYQWLGYVLSRFPYTRPWGERFASFLVDTLLGMLSGIAQSIPGCSSRS